MIIKENLKEKITEAADVALLITKILQLEHEVDRDKEHFWVIGMNTQSRVLYIELVTLGTLNRAIVEPREVFRLAIMKATAKIILVHNHPSGEARPSPEDLEITRKLVSAGKLLEIKVLDHVIVGGTDSFWSASDEGLLQT